jgi:hypothetical protein
MSETKLPRGRHRKQGHVNSKCVKPKCCIGQYQIAAADKSYGQLHRILVNHVLIKRRFKLNGVLKFVSFHRIF